MTVRHKTMAKINQKKYKNAVVFFAKRIQNGTLGKLKMMKLLYYLDFIYFRDHKKSVTGDIYIHEGYGPVPARVDEILAKLKNEGTIDTESVPYNDAEMINFQLCVIGLRDVETQGYLKVSAN